MGSKQGIITEEDRVLKVHLSVHSADLERTIGELYSGNKSLLIRTPHYFDPEITNGVVYLPMQKIKGKNLMHNTNPTVTKTLVRDLALFHEIFSQSDRTCDPNVLYRDAIASNYMEDDQGLIHIDFSSSNRYVHCFDDLALLLHPEWNRTTPKQRRGAIESYFSWRKYFHSERLRKNSIIRSFTLLDLSVEEKSVFYQATIKQMEDTIPGCRNFKEEMLRVNFGDLDESDFYTFFKFRDFRAKYYLQKWSQKNEN